MKFSVLRRRAVRRALGTLSLSAAMLVASTSANVSLHANQEETEAAPAETGLGVPDDLSGEKLEAIDPALATALGPSLEALFDTARPSQERLAAAGEVDKIARSIQVNSPALHVLKRQLLRRSALINAAVQASEGSTAGPSTNVHTTQLAQAISETESMLNAMSNGGGWVTYLHLADLKSGAAPATMEQVIRNLTTSESMNNAQLVFLNRPAFQNLKAALESAVAAESPSADEAAARTALTSRINALVSALLAYEKNALAADAEKARTEWRSLRSRFPAAADIMRAVVNEHYFNHNVHFTVSEQLLSRLISDYRTESGNIADCVMGAWVTGSQTTSVDVRADIKPSNTTARFDLSVNGNTQSNTRAQKSPATVWTAGNHYFWMNRSVFFDGRNVSATPASFSVDTNSRTVGLATKYDGIPIIRGIVRRMASQKIAETKPQADALTADRLRDEALPKFQSETDSQFATGNDTLSKMLHSLERRGVGPDSISARSSNTQIAVSSRTIGIARLGGSVQPPAVLMANGAAAQIHESALNNAIDALGFQGRDIPEKEFVTELEVALSDLFQREIKLTNGEPAPAAEGEADEPPTVFLFSKSDPIRVRFDNGQIILQLRTGIRQEGKEEIPEETVTIPIAMTLENGKIVVNPGNIAVTGRPTRSVQIKRVLARRIVRKELSPTIDLQAAGDKTLPVTVTHIELNDGWLTTEMQ